MLVYYLPIVTLTCRLGLHLCNSGLASQLEYLRSFQGLLVLQMVARVVAWRFGGVGRFVVSYRLLVENHPKHVSNTSQVLRLQKYVLSSTPRDDWSFLFTYPDLQYSYTIQELLVKLYQSVSLFETLSFTPLDHHGSVLCNLQFTGSSRLTRCNLSSS